MNAGVPRTAFPRVCITLPSGVSRDRSHNPEIQHLHEVVLLAVAAEEDVRRLDVAVHQAAGLRLGERVADLAQDVDGPLGRNRAEAAEQRVGIEPVEQLHDVVEGPVVGIAEIEELHGVGRAEPGDHLGLALEPAHRLVRHSGAPFPAREGRISLIAAGRVSMRWRARQTSPIPPSPSFSSSW